ncbi:MAG: hypothetical protein QXM75_00685, partial [Candidatus Diapherotrites archaeon]
MKGVKAIFILFLFCLANATFSQISGPENIFINVPIKTQMYEIYNASSEVKDIQLSVYCPAEIKCEVVEVPKSVQPSQKASFTISFMPSDAAIRNTYVATLVGSLGNERVYKKIEVTVGIPKIVGQATSEDNKMEEIQQPGEQESVTATTMATAQQTVIM